MTAAPAASVGEAMARLAAGQSTAQPGLGAPAFVAEIKYDGERCQLHWIPRGAGGLHPVPGGADSAAGDASRDVSGDAPTDVRIFARSLDEMTARFPDVVAAFRDAMRGNPAAIIDAEVRTRAAYAFALARRSTGGQCHA